MISTTNSRRCNSIPDAESLYTRICTVCKLFLQIMQNIFKRGRTVRMCGRTVHSRPNSCGCFFNAASSSSPSPPQHTISPTKTEKANSGIDSGISDIFAITNGMMIVFAAIGGSGASHAPRDMPPGRVREVFFPSFRRAKVPIAPISVARLPKTRSYGNAPVIKLDSRQPINSPGIAAGVKYGRIVNASDTRN